MDIERVMRRIGERYRPAMSDVDAVIRSSKSRLRDRRRRVTSGIVAFGVAFAGIGFGLHSLLGGTVGNTAPLGGHAAAPGSDCPLEPFNASVSSNPAQSGSTVTVSGPVSYLREDGSVQATGDEDLQVWWNVYEASWPQVAAQAIGISQGRQASSPVTDDPAIFMLGDDHPEGACSFAIKFAVPDSPAGSYPVAVLLAGGNGVTLYDSFILEVTSSQGATGP